MKQIITLLAIVFTCTYGFGQIPTTGLVAYYPFNGNTQDESANTNHAALNGATLATDRFGNQNSAYDFDGVDDFMTVAHHNSIDFDAFTESYSFSYWINSSTPKLTDFAFRLFEKRLTNQGTEPYPVIIGGVVGQNDYSSQYVIADGTPPSTNITTPGNEWDGNWHHMAFIADNANFELRIYMDGILIASTPFDLSSTAASTGDLLIGTNFDNNIFYHGLMDDIRLYEQALTPCEIYALYMEDNPTQFTSESQLICEGDSYTFPDGNTLNNIAEDTTYLSYFPSVLTGCDSAVVETNLSVTLVDETITVGGLGMTLTSNVSTGATYQWIDCDNNMSPIIGETNQSYNATANGNYALIITQSGCVDTSECTVINSAGIDELHSNFALYPNPTNDILAIETGEELIGKNYVLYDLKGQEILRSTFESELEFISMRPFGAGMYYLSVEGTAIRKRVVVK